MDYSKLSDKELLALHKGDYSQLSDDTLKMLASTKKSQAQEIASSDESLGEQAKAGLIGAAQGASFGFADEAEAGLKSALSEDKYSDLIKDIRERNKALSEKYPVTSTAGELAGGVGSMLLGGELLAGAKGAKNVASGLSSAAKLSDTLKTGAAVGALTGAGSSEAEDLTGLAKDTAVGAGEGAALSGILHGIGNLTSGVKKVVTKLPALEDIQEGYHVGKKPLDVFGKEEELANKFKENIGNKVFKTIEDADSNLKAGYDSIYKIADSKTQPLPTENLYSKLEDTIDALSTPESKIFLPEDELSKLKSFIKQKTGAGMRGITSEEVPEGLNLLSASKFSKANYTTQELAGLANNIQRQADGASNNPMLRQAFLALKQDVQEVVDERLPEALKTAKASLDDKYRSINTVKELFDMPSVLHTDTGAFSENVADYDKVLTNITKKFERGYGKDNIDNKQKVDMAMDYLKKVIGDDKVNSMLTDISEDARTLNVANTLRKKSILEASATNAGLSGSALKTNLGYWSAKAENKAASSAKEFASNLVSKVAGNTPEAAMEVANKLATDPNTKKFGDMLGNIINNPDVSRRRALMFSLNQQPAFREALEKHYGNSQNEE